MNKMCNTCTYLYVYYKFKIPKCILHLKFVSKFINYHIQDILSLEGKSVQIKTHSRQPGTGDLSSAFHLCNPKPRNIAKNQEKERQLKRKL